MSTDTPMGRPARDGGTEDGIRWVTLDAPMFGAVNGYVQVPEGHPWHPADDYNELDVDVHGGLTYADGDWIGFDTMHAFDHWPGMTYTVPGDLLWTAEMVKQETVNLAMQVAEAAKTVTR